MWFKIADIQNTPIPDLLVALTTAVFLDTSHKQEYEQSKATKSMHRYAWIFCFDKSQARRSQASGRAFGQPLDILLNKTKNETRCTNIRIMKVIGHNWVLCIKWMMMNEADNGLSTIHYMSQITYEAALPLEHYFLPSTQAQ